MILITLYDHGKLFLRFEDAREMATAYAGWAQLNGYRIEMESI